MKKLRLGDKEFVWNITGPPFVTTHVREIVHQKAFWFTFVCVLLSLRSSSNSRRTCFRSCFCHELPKLMKVSPLLMRAQEASSSRSSAHPRSRVSSSGRACRASTLRIRRPAAAAEGGTACFLYLAEPEGGDEALLRASRDDRFARCSEGSPTNRFTCGTGAAPPRGAVCRASAPRHHFRTTVRRPPPGPMAQLPSVEQAPTHREAAYVASLAGLQHTSCRPQDRESG